MVFLWFFSIIFCTIWCHTDRPWQCCYKLWNSIKTRSSTNKHDPIPFKQITYSYVWVIKRAHCWSCLDSVDFCCLSCFFFYLYTVHAAHIQTKQIHHRLALPAPFIDHNRTSLFRYLFCPTTSYNNVVSLLSLSSSDIFIKMLSESSAHYFNFNMQIIRSNLKIYW